MFAHDGEEVGQVKGRARTHHGHRAGGVEAEEEDAGRPVPRHVRPEVQLGNAETQERAGSPRGRRPSGRKA